MPSAIKKGYFGAYGGRFVPEVLRPALDELERAFESALEDQAFMADCARAAEEFIGRPTPLYHARNLSERLGGADLFIKMEGLAHTGAHKINNALGQAMLARRMGKKRVIAETGAGQHGVATAAACAKLGLECTVYMGETDMARQRPNVFSMELAGARVVPVSSGSRTLKDAINEALRDWTGSSADTYYLLGSALGPAPYPDIVRTFQSVVGKETQSQAIARGLDVAAMVACVGGGSNAIGFFSPFLDAPKPRLIAVEAGGHGDAAGSHARRMSGEGSVGIAHGYKSIFLQDADGQIGSTSSISAGLDYAGIGPELAHLRETGRVEFESATDREALEALCEVAKSEGILFALESAHAASVALRVAREGERGSAVIVNMSGRGDKDLFITARALDRVAWISFLESEVNRHD